MNFVFLAGACGNESAEPINMNVQFGFTFALGPSQLSSPTLWPPIINFCRSGGTPGREGKREGGREEGREGEREVGRKGGREGGREGGRKGGTKRKREGGRKGGRER